MKYVTCEIKDKCAYLIPIGDLHAGDSAFLANASKIKNYIKWVKETPNARVVLGGDLFNTATRDSKTSPFDRGTINDREIKTIDKYSIYNDEFEMVYNLFEPIKDKIITAISGNHEQRLKDFANIDLTAHLCFRLGVPYMGYSGVVAFRVGKFKNGFRQYYTLYFHHTTGGGSTLGSKLNRVVKLAELIEGCDAYCGFHGHGKITGIENVYYPSHEAKDIKCRKRLFVSCGSYLEWIGSYAEQKMLRPASLGSPRIRLDGRRDKHDVHCSL